MADTVAIWSISLDTQCPKCYHDFDIMDYDRDAIEGVAALQTGRDIDITCPECEHEFEARLEF